MVVSKHKQLPIISLKAAFVLFPVFGLGTDNMACYNSW